MWEGEALARMGSDRDFPNVSSRLRADRERTEPWTDGGSGEGPTAAPLEATAPYTPNARARSLGAVNVTATRDSAVGVSRAANAP